MSERDQRVYPDKSSPIARIFEGGLPREISFGERMGNEVIFEFALLSSLPAVASRIDYEGAPLNLIAIGTEFGVHHFLGDDTRHEGDRFLVDPANGWIWMAISKHGGEFGFLELWNTSPEKFEEAILRYQCFDHSKDDPEALRYDLTAIDSEAFTSETRHKHWPNALEELTLEAGWRPRS